ncbi:hypothetical protein N0V94_002956 [Neodidymelliopsis sp. IMI 364377]|nr:hypothetical protein N0V94_002956 [Neodidymelliopsis sp. IMI 364377]
MSANLEDAADDVVDFDPHDFIEAQRALDEADDDEDGESEDESDNNHDLANEIMAGFGFEQDEGDDNLPETEASMVNPNVSTQNEEQSDEDEFEDVPLYTAQQPGTATATTSAASEGLTATIDVEEEPLWPVSGKRKKRKPSKTHNWHGKPRVFNDQGEEIGYVEPPPAEHTYVFVSDDFIPNGDPYHAKGCEKRTTFESDPVPEDLQYKTVARGEQLNAVDKLFNWCKTRPTSALRGQPGFNQEGYNDGRRPRHFVLKMGPPNGPVGDAVRVAQRLGQVIREFFYTRLAKSYLTIELEIPFIHIAGTGYFKEYLDKIRGLMSPMGASAKKFTQRLDVILAPEPTAKFRNCESRVFYPEAFDYEAEWKKRVGQNSYIWWAIDPSTQTHMPDGWLPTKEQREEAKLAYIARGDTINAEKPVQVDAAIADIKSFIDEVGNFRNRETSTATTPSAIDAFHALADNPTSPAQGADTASHVAQLSAHISPVPVPTSASDSFTAPLPVVTGRQDALEALEQTRTHQMPAPSSSTSFGATGSSNEAPSHVVNAPTSRWSPSAHTPLSSYSSAASQLFTRGQRSALHRPHSLMYTNSEPRQPRRLLPGRQESVTAQYVTEANPLTSTTLPRTASQFGHRTTPFAPQVPQEVHQSSSIELPYGLGALVEWLQSQETTEVAQSNTGQAPTQIERTYAPAYGTQSYPTEYAQAPQQPQFLQRPQYSPPQQYSRAQQYPQMTSMGLQSPSAEGMQASRNLQTPTMPSQGLRWPRRDDQSLSLTPLDALNTQPHAVPRETQNPAPHNFGSGLTQFNQSVYGAPFVPSRPQPAHTLMPSTPSGRSMPSAQYPSATQMYPVSSRNPAVLAQVGSASNTSSARGYYSEAQQRALAIQELQRQHAEQQYTEGNRIRLQPTQPAQAPYPLGQLGATVAGVPRDGGLAAQTPPPASTLGKRRGDDEHDETQGEKGSKQ